MYDETRAFSFRCFYLFTVIARIDIPHFDSFRDPLPPPIVEVKVHVMIVGQVYPHSPQSMDVSEWRNSMLRSLGKLRVRSFHRLSAFLVPREL